MNAKEIMTVEEILTLYTRISNTFAIYEKVLAERDKLKAELKEARESQQQTLIDFCQQLKDYTHESHAILGYDEIDALDYKGNIIYNQGHWVEMMEDKNQKHAEAIYRLVKDGAYFHNYEELIKSIKRYLDEKF